jgi:hypothetical protein
VLLQSRVSPHYVTALFACAAAGFVSGKLEGVLLLDEEAARKVSPGRIGREPAHKQAEASVKRVARSMAAKKSGIGEAFLRGRQEAAG